MAFMWIPQIFTPDTISFEFIFEVICSLVFIFAFSGIGLFLLHKIVINKKTILVISSKGIEYGNDFFPWKDIQELGVMSKYTLRRDLYCQVKSKNYVVELLLSKGLNSF